MTSTLASRTATYAFDPSGLNAMDQGFSPEGNETIGLPTMLSVASDHISTASTWLFALLSAAGVLGCAIFPWVIGALGDGFGLRSAVLVLPASMLVLLALMIPAARLVRRRRHRAEVA